MEVNSAKKEAYFTATQMQLVRTRFFGNRTAMIAGSILLFMIVCSLFADFLSPYDPTIACLLYTSPSPRDVEESRMPSSA